MKHEITVKDIGSIDKAAGEFLEQIRDRKIIAFYGQMGVGKTTFTKAICRALGVEDMVNSPTFAIVNEYESSVGDKIYHFDFYRLKSAREALDIGLEEYFASGCLCLMEWPEIIEDLLPSDVLKVYITENDNSERIIRFD